MCWGPRRRRAKAGAVMAQCCWCASRLGRWERPGVSLHESPWLCPTPACQQKQFGYATYTQVTKSGAIKDVLYLPTPVQVTWHDAVYVRSTTRLLVGGQAGPGKSRWLRETLYRFAQQVPGFHGLLLRRTHKDLDQSHLRFVPFEVQQRGGHWMAGERVVKFSHKGKPDAIIRMGHLEDAGALANYLSSEYDVIAPDELVTFDRDEMLELFSRARSSNAALFALRGGYRYLDVNEDGDPEWMETDGSMVLTATNPGGKGARWIKDFFIDQTPDADEHPNYRKEFWAFHGARLKDNPYIKRSYVSTLKDLSDTRRRQLLDGDWDAFEGQFFEWRATQDGQPWHVQDLGLDA
jgi:hypothetical protein